MRIILLKISSHEKANDYFIYFYLELISIIFIIYSSISRIFSTLFYDNILTIITIFGIIGILIVTSCLFIASFILFDHKIKEKMSPKNKVLKEFEYMLHHYVFYHISTAFTFVFALFFMVLALVSEEAYKGSVLTLFIFYAIIGILRFVILKVHLKLKNKYYKDNKAIIYKKEHIMSLIVAIILAAFSGVMGTAITIAINNKATADVSMASFLVITIPSSLTKIWLAKNTADNAKKNNDPFLQTLSSITFIVSIITIGNVIGIINHLIKIEFVNNIFKTILSFISFIILIIVIILIVKSIKGLSGKKDINNPEYKPY